MGDSQEKTSLLGRAVATRYGDNDSEYQDREMKREYSTFVMAGQQITEANCCFVRSMWQIDDVVCLVNPEDLPSKTMKCTLSGKPLRTIDLPSMNQFLTVLSFGGFFSGKLLLKLFSLLLICFYSLFNMIDSFHYQTGTISYVRVSLRAIVPLCETLAILISWKMGINLMDQKLLTKVVHSTFHNSNGSPVVWQQLNVIFVTLLCAMVFFVLTGGFATYLHVYSDEPMVIPLKGKQGAVAALSPANEVHGTHAHIHDSFGPLGVVLWALTATYSSFILIGGISQVIASILAFHVRLRSAVHYIEAQCPTRHALRRLLDLDIQLSHFSHKYEFYITAIAFLLFGQCFFSAYFTVTAVKGRFINGGEFTTALILNTLVKPLFLLSFTMIAFAILNSSSSTLLQACRRFLVINFREESSGEGEYRGSIVMEKRKKKKGKVSKKGDKRGGELTEKELADLAAFKEYSKRGRFALKIYGVTFGTKSLLKMHVVTWTVFVLLLRMKRWQLID